MSGSFWVTVHVVDAKIRCPSRSQVVRSEAYGRFPSLTARDLGSNAASGAGDDLGASRGAGPAAGGNHAVESHCRRIGPAVGAQLAQFLPAALGGPAPNVQTIAPRPQWASARRAAWPRGANAGAGPGGGG